MITLLPKCHLQGDNFSPKKVEGSTGLAFAKKNEPGEIGTVGRYKGTAIPYGSATLQLSGEALSASQDVLREFLALIKRNLDAFRKNGASDVTLDLVVFHDGQCNLEFSIDELREITQLGLPLTLSTYECPEEVEKRRPVAQ
jgi:hypothetical protein